jgi:hypothetical protein
MAMDPEGGERAKQLGMDRAERAANPEWRVFMEAAVVSVARNKRLFFCDDIEAVRMELNGPETHENRALGPLMLWAMREGVCERTDDFALSARASRHRAPCRIWRSLIYGRGR